MAIWGKVVLEKEQTVFLKQVAACNSYQRSPEELQGKVRELANQYFSEEAGAHHNLAFVAKMLTGRLQFPEETDKIQLLPNVQESLIKACQVIVQEWRASLPTSGEASAAEARFPLAVSMEEIFLTIPTPLLFVDNKGTITRTNPCTQRILKLMEGELEGKSLNVLFPPAVFDEWQRKIKEINGNQDEKVTSPRFEYVLKDGTPFFFEAKTFHLGQGCFVVSFTDVTEAERQRKEDMESLRSRSASFEKVAAEATHSQELQRVQYEELYYTSPFYQMSLDLKEKKICMANPAALAALGYKEHELIGMPVDQITYPPYREKVQAAFVQFMRDGYIKNFQSVWRCQDGKPLHISMSSVAVRDEKGKIVMSNSVAFDLGPQMALEEVERKLRLAEEAKNKAIRDFVQFVSHDMLTPLNAVSGFAQLLQLSQPFTDEQRELCLHIYGGASHLERLIRSILNFTKIESGTVEVSPLNFSLRDFIQTMEADFEELAQKKGIQLQVKLKPTEVETLFGDVDLVRRILNNLLSNSLKKTPRGESITIEVDVTVEGDNAQFNMRVEDTGEGISPEILEQVWEPFKQGDPSHDFKSSGFGLGLPSVKLLVEQMQGKIAISSQVGKGTCVSCSIPMKVTAKGKEKTTSAVSSRAPTPIAMTLSALKGTLEILIVEDNPSNIIVLRGMIMSIFRDKPVNCKITVVENGLEALKFLLEVDALPTTKDKALDKARIIEFLQAKRDSISYQIIFMDIQMPVLDGKETTLILRAAGVDTTIYAVTANVSREAKAEYAKIGMQFLGKPVHLSKLRKILEPLVGLPSAAQSTASLDEA